jgi:hypothetical protein
MTPILLTCLMAMVHSGADFTPKTLDSAGIAAALQQARPGDTVRLPVGVCELTVAIRLKSAVKLIGAGQDKTRLVYRGTKQSALIACDGCRDVELAQLTLEGQSNPLLTAGIAGGDSLHVWIHHVTIRDLVKNEGFGPIGIFFSGDNPTLKHGLVDSRISDCRMENIGVGASFGGGIRLAWGCVRNRIDGNVIERTGRGGIFGDHSAELTIVGNRVSGSGGEGLGIEIWEQCVRSVIEDNRIDHWLSVGGGDQSAVRRNTVVARDGSLKGIGIEVTGRDCIVSGNTVGLGQMTGLSVSNVAVKNNVYWADNSVSGCVQWGAQLQGDTGGIAHHYFYRCTFEDTLLNDPRAQYPGCTGFGFRFNGATRQVVFDACAFRNNGSLGVQLAGEGVDALDFRGCSITGNGGPAISGPEKYTALEFAGCQVNGNPSNHLTPAKPFAAARPKAAFSVSEAIRVGEPARFQCGSKAPGGTIVERLWDFDDGIPQMTPSAEHVYTKPGRYRVALIVWDSAGRGARAEKLIDVQP